MFELFKIMPLPTPELFVPVPTISRVSDKKMADYTITLTIPIQWNTMSENEKEEEWKDQVEPTLYDFYHVNKI
jgi:hypothetical protein